MQAHTVYMNPNTITFTDAIGNVRVFHVYGDEEAMRHLGVTVDDAFFAGDIKEVTFEPLTMAKAGRMIHATYLDEMIVAYRNGLILDQECYDCGRPMASAADCMEPGEPYKCGCGTGTNVPRGTVIEEPETLECAAVLELADCPF